MPTENQSPQATHLEHSGPAASEQIQAHPGHSATGIAERHADTSSIPLPPPEAAPQPEVVEGLHVVFDGALAFLVLVLTFLLGSFVATNSDLWLTLGTGKQIAQGEYRFGVDPFSFVTEAHAGQPAKTWVNQQWLSSWLFYAVFSLFGGVSGWGGAALVVLKAAALTVLALLLLTMRSSSPSRFWAIVTVTLGMLAVSTHALLQPMTFSYVLLGLTLYLLYRGGALGALAPGQTASRRALWCVPLLCAAWVNLDSWFILGPLTVSLLALGAGAGAAIGIKSPLPGKAWGALLAGSWLACLLNPHHILGATTLPPELAYVVCQLFGDHAVSLITGGTLLDGGVTLYELQRLEPTVIMISPLSRQYATNPLYGLNWGGMAFYMLVVLSLVSFLIKAGASKKEGAPGFPVGRLLVWFVFTGLAMSLARLIPFFAVAAAAIAIRNFDEWMAWRTVPIQRQLDPLNYTLGRSVRWCVLAMLLVMLFLAWPGWLHVPFGDFTSPHRVAWQVRPDESLEKAARRLGELHAERKRLHVFNFSADLAHYCAWFAPEVKCFFDFRYSLYADQVENYVKVRAQLLGKKDQNVNWEAFFEKFGIEHVAINNFDTNSPRAELAKKWWADPAHWRQEYSDGRNLVFAHEAEKESLASKWDRSAFGEVPPPERAPAGGMVANVGERAFLDQYLGGVPPQSLSSRRANFYSTLHVEKIKQLNEARGKYKELISQHLRAAHQVAGFDQVGLGSVPMACMLAQEQLFLYDLTPQFTHYLTRRRYPDLGPPALPLLALRQARRAVQDNPYHFSSYLAGSMACSGLAQQEEFWLTASRQDRGEFRTSLRQAQTVAALRAYVDVDPENSQAHFNLADHYSQIYYVDVALDHHKLAIKYYRENPPGRLNETDPLEFKNRVQNFEGQIQKWDRDIKRRRADLEAQGAGYGDLERCELALLRPYKGADANNQPTSDPKGMGLAKEVLKILENAPVKSLLPKEQIRLLDMQIRIMLNLGRAHEVQAVLPDLEKIFTDKDGRIVRDYYQYPALLAGALGDYAGFDAALAKWEEEFDPTRKKMEFEMELVATSLMARLGSASPIALGGQLKTQLLSSNRRYLSALSQWSARRAMRGLMKLEQGDTAMAARFLQDALDTNINFPDRPIADRYLKLLQEQQR